MCVPQQVQPESSTVSRSSCLQRGGGCGSWWLVWGCRVRRVP